VKCNFQNLMNLIKVLLILATLSGVFSALTIAQTNDVFGSYDYVQGIAGYGTLAPISQTQYFTSDPAHGGIDVTSCENARRSAEDERAQTYGEPWFGKNPGIDYFSLYNVNVNRSATTTIITNNEQAEAHAIYMMIKNGLISNTNFSSIYSCFLNDSCETAYHDYLDSFFPSGVNWNTRSLDELKRTPSSCGIACGNTIQVTDFTASLGDALMLSTAFNATNTMIETGATIQVITLKEFNVTYPLIDGFVYGTDINVDSKCVCHCPFSPETAGCTSTYDGCTDNTNICVNSFTGGQNDWSCPLNVGYSSSYCCSTEAVETNRMSGFQIGSPTAIVARFDLSLVTYAGATVGPFPTCAVGKCWQIKTYSMAASFGSSDLAFNFDIAGTEYQWDCVYTSHLKGSLEMSVVGELFGYKGGDLILVDTSGDTYYNPTEPLVATGWDIKYDSDASQPGWLKYNNVSALYNPNSLLQNTNVHLKNCLTDSFVVTSTVSSSSTANLQTLTDYLAPFGTYTVDLTNKQLNIAPRTMQSAIFRYTSNLPSTVTLRGGKLTSFNCSRTAPNSAVLLTCSLYGYTGGSICFTIYGADDSPLGVSCSAPTPQARSLGSVIYDIQLSYAVGVITVAGSLCANGYDEVPCISVNITNTAYNEYDPSWVGSGVTFTNNDVQPTYSYDFGDWTTWNDSITSVVYTILLFAAIIIGVIVCIVLSAFLVWMIMFMSKKYKMMSQARKIENAFTRKSKGQKYQELGEVRSKPGVVQINDALTSFDNDTL